MARRLEDETKRQFAETDKVLQTCADFLSHPDVHRVTNGLAKRALSLLTLLYVPNHIDGTYHITGKEHDGHGIPIILTRGNKRVQIQRDIQHSIHPEQIMKLESAFQTVEKQSLSTDDFELRLNVLRTFHNEEYGETQLVHEELAVYDACVYAPTALIGLGTTHDDVETYFTYTSPVVIGKSDLLVDDDGDILFHELVHVHQSLAGELTMSDSKKARDARPRAELEAYWAQASALEVHTGLTVEGDNPYDWNCYGVESVRREFNGKGKDPFKITRALLRAVERNGSKLI